MVSAESERVCDQAFLTESAASFSSEVLVTKRRGHRKDEKAAKRFNVKAVSSAPLGFHLLKSTRPYRFN